MPKIDNIIFMLGMVMLLPWSLIAYIAWVFWYKPKYIHKPRSYGRIDLTKVKPCSIETNKQLSHLLNK